MGEEMRPRTIFDVVVGVVGILGGAATMYQVAVPQAREAARAETAQSFLDQLASVGFNVTRASNALDAGNVELSINQSVTFEDIDRRISDAVASALAVERNAVPLQSATGEIGPTEPPDGLFENSSCIPINELMGRNTAILRSGMEFCADDGRPLVRITRVTPPGVGMANGSINYVEGAGGSINCGGPCTFGGTEVPRFDLERHAVEGGQNVVLVRF